MVEAIYLEIKERWKDCAPCRTIRERVNKNKGKTLFLYGAGRLAKVFLEACEEMQISVAGICDTYARGEYNGISIISPQELFDRHPDAIVLICSHTYSDEIYAKLVGRGYSREQIISCPIQFPYFTSPSQFLVHIEGYKWAYHFFEDPKSKQLVLDRMRMYLLDEPTNVNTESDCYYEKDAIRLSSKEVFVDAGAYVGDTAEEFIGKVKGEYESVYSFEPSEGNYEKAVERLKQYHGVQVIQKGLWSCDTTLTFFEDTSNMAGSCIKGEGGEFSIAVTTLDNVFSMKEKFPTFIKMDIEGSEKEALIGAKNVIERNKPKLAICAYHKPEDIYELPQTIQRIQEGYRFVLRQHSKGCFDMVLYAV